MTEAKPATKGSEGDGEEIVNVRRRQSRSKQTRKKILEAATAEFAAVGFNGASTRSIAERAQVLHGLVIYHFETKQGVWKAVLEEVVNDFHEQYKATLKLLKDADPVEKLKSLNRNYVHLAATRPELHWLISNELRETSPEGEDWIVHQILEADVAHTVDLIREVQALGQYVEGDPAHLHYLFLGASSQVFMLGSRVENSLGVSLVDKDFIERHVDACESLFFRSSKE